VAVREDYVQNAVKFLSHPKVRGSPVLYRRSFLEKKGLTKDEIDEAFRRVPVSVSSHTHTPPSFLGLSVLLPLNCLPSYTTGSATQRYCYCCCFPFAFTAP
jgi:hypothetical protein